MARNSGSAANSSTGSAAGSTSDILNLLAVIERKQGNHEKSLAIYAGLLQSHDSDPVTHNNLGNCYKEMGRFEDAVRHYERALQLHSRYTDACVNLSLALRKLDRLEQAQNCLQQMLTTSAKVPALWHALSMVLRDRGEIEKAIDALEHAIPLNSDNHKLLHLRAQLEAERGGHATPLFRTALARDPHNRDLQLAYIVAQVEEGRAAEAIAQLQALLVAEPDWVKGHAALSQIIWQHADKAQYLDSFYQATALRPHDLPLLIGCFTAMMRSGNFAAVLQGLERARGLFDEPHLFDRYQAVCASECGDLQTADRYFRKCHDDADTQLQLARVRYLLRIEAYIAAAELAERLAGEGVQEAWPYVSLLWRLLKEKRYAWLERLPEFVSVVDIPQIVEIAPVLMQTLRSRHVARNHPYDQSMRGGSQTDGNLLLQSSAPLQITRRCIERETRQFAMGLPPRDMAHPFLKFRNRVPEILASYSVLLKQNGYHVSHMHPDTWISCCLYAEVPDSIGVSESDPSGWLSLGEPPGNLNIELPPLLRVKPQVGRLVMFPSIMWHGTVPVRSGERMSVVCDLVAV